MAGFSPQAPTDPSQTQGQQPKRDPNDPNTWSPEERAQFYGGLYSATGGYGGGTTVTEYNPVTNQATPPTQAPAPAGPPPPDMIQRSDYALPYGQDIMGALRNRATDVLGRTNDSDVRQQQMALAGMLNRYATGQDSVSQQQLRQAADANIASQMAMAAGARPGGAQLAALNAAQNAGAINTQLAGQQALAGINERYQAQNALGQLLSGTRGQDLTFGQQNDAAYQQALAQQLATAQLMQQGSMGYSQALQQREALRQQLATQLQAAGMNRPGVLESILGGAVQAGGMYASTLGKKPDQSFLGGGNVSTPQGGWGATDAGPDIYSGGDLA